MRFVRKRDVRFEGGKSEEERTAEDEGSDEEEGCHAECGREEQAGGGSTRRALRCAIEGLVILL